MKKDAVPPFQANFRPMAVAFLEAEAAKLRGEVPIGAVIVFKNEIITQAGNRTRELNDPTAHAEILAIRQACTVLNSERLPQCDLYVTLEPCTMCASAISFARMRRLYYSASDEKGGGIEFGARFYHQPTCHHVPDVYSGFDEKRGQQILHDFFKNIRR